MKKITSAVILLAAAGAGAGAFYMRRDVQPPEVRTAQISRGDIVDVVQATGSLEAVTTVEVGTQVGGIIQDLYADFNSIVKKGQVIARLDPSLLQTQIEQQRANVIRSEADLERLKVALADAKQKLERANALFQKALLPRTDLEAAEVTERSAEAQIKSSEAALAQARSQLNAAQVNLAHTVIAAPIDGIVIQRAVEPGQTVNAGMSAPTLFVLAADLTKMEVNASVDEADVGKMRPGQSVTFRVDAFPNETFTGSVSQVRLQPTTVQNVVTYQTVIAVPNQQLKLKPGMTANVTIEVARRTNVLRIPVAATRFRPTNEMFAALKQEPPAPMGRRPGTATAERRVDAPTTDVALAVNAGVRDEVRGTSGANAQKGRVASVPSITSGATTVDSLFGPLPTVETRGRAWRYADKKLQPVPLRLGLSDGTFVEVLDGEGLTEGTDVATNVILPAAQASAAPAGGTGNPLLGPQRGGPGGARGGAGGGRGF